MNNPQKSKSIRWRMIVAGLVCVVISLAAGVALHSASDACLIFIVLWLVVSVPWSALRPGSRP